MTRYKFYRHAGLVDEEGKIILHLVPVGCTKKFREMAGKELANKLNGIEQGKEAAAFAAKRRNIPGCDCPFCGRGHMVEQVPGTGYRKCDHCGERLL